MDTSGGKVPYYAEQYRRSSLASAVILPYLDGVNALLLTTGHLAALAAIVATMQGHKPFALVTVHDEFKAHSNHINQVRKHYRSILAELADSTVLDDILSQIHGRPGKFPKLSTTLGSLIRQSDYALT
jgi:hypothetical protein